MILNNVRTNLREVVSRVAYHMRSLVLGQDRLMHREALVIVLICHFLNFLRPDSERTHTLMHSVASFAVISFNLQSSMGLALVDYIESSHYIFK